MKWHKVLCTQMYFMHGSNEKYAESWERESERERKEERWSGNPFPIVFYSPDDKIWRDTKCQWKMYIKMHMKHLQYFYYAFLCPFLLLFWLKSFVMYERLLQIYLISQPLDLEYDSFWWYKMKFICSGKLNEFISFHLIWSDLCINKFISKTN